jgi:hypothetical protein
MCITYCFSTATIVARTRLSITLFVHRLSCKLRLTVWRAITVICAPFRVRKPDMSVGLRCYCCLVALWGQTSQKKVLTLENKSGDDWKMEITSRQRYTLNKMSLTWPDHWLCLYPPCVDEDCIANLVAKYECCRSLGRYRFRPTCEYNIKMGVKECNVDWRQLFQYNFQLLDFLNTETNLPVSWKFPIKTIWPNVKKGCVVLVIWCYIPAPEC